MRRRGSAGVRDTNRSSVSTVEDEGNAALPEPLLEQPKGAPPLSQLAVDSLALVVDGPSLVSYFPFDFAFRLFFLFFIFSFRLSSPFSLFSHAFFL